jgi:monofunctional biosynthetic peptidoglycan transglycosylase
VFGLNRKRLRRWLLRGLVGFVVISLLPVIVLRWVTPSTSAVMLQRSLAEGRAQDYRWVPLERISPQVALAVVAAEDQKFPQHWGFDIEAIWNAARRNVSGGRLRGASTLTQQVARNLFLWQGRSYLRKGLEAWMTALLELVWPKRRILEVYLNIAEMGVRSFGVEAASRRYYGQSAHALSREQSALLAAILPSPRRYRIDNPSAYISERRAWILEQMSLLGGTAYLQDIL